MTVTINPVNVGTCKFTQYLTATKPMSKLLLKLLCENEENDSYINITLHMHQVCYAQSRH